MLLPLVGYLKNKAVFGRFQSSSYFGYSVLRTHVSWGYYRPDNIMNLPVFGPHSQRTAFFDTTDPLIERYRHIPMLNRDDWSDVRHILLSEASQRFLAEHVSPTWIFNQILNGVALFYRSP